MEGQPRLTPRLRSSPSFRVQVLPIAAFYDARCNVAVNALAEVSSHRNHRVRLRCCRMLAYFLVFLPDRYDHQQRLLPYVLSFVNDAVPAIREAALRCVETCGLQYEREHPDEVVERRQFGVDGDDAIDYNSHLPAPFATRPSLGARLFVRANTSRFFHALLRELSHWRRDTRRRSAELLLVLTAYCEERLAQDFHRTLAALARARAADRVEAGGGHDPTLATVQDILRSLAKYSAGDDTMARELAQVQSVL